MAPRKGTEWLPEQDAELRRLYVEMGLEPRHIAVRLRMSVKRIMRRIDKRRLGALLTPEEKNARRRARLAMALEARQARMRRKGFCWSPERDEQFRRLYLERHWPAGRIAAHFGATVNQIRGRRAKFGLAAIRRERGLRIRLSPKGFNDQPVRRLAMGESNPLAFRLTKDPPAALAKANRRRELNLTMAQVEAREVRRAALTASAADQAEAA